MGSTQTTVQSTYLRYSTPLPPSCVTSLPGTLSPCRLGSLPSDNRHPLTAQHPQPQSMQADLTHYTTTLPDHFISGWAREEASTAHLDLNFVKAAPKYLPRHGRPLQHHYTISTGRELQKKTEEAPWQPCPWQQKSHRVRHHIHHPVGYLSPSLGAV